MPSDSWHAEVACDGGGPPEGNIGDDNVWTVLLEDAAVFVLSKIDGHVDFVFVARGDGGEVFLAVGEADGFGRELVEEDIDGRVERSTEEGGIGGGEAEGGIHVRVAGEEDGEVGHRDHVAGGEERDEEDSELLDWVLCHIF